MLFALSLIHILKSEPPSSADCLAALLIYRRGEALRKRHPFLLLLYRISEALSNIAQRPEMPRKISPPPLTFPFPSGIISKV